jgi:hypothetical protein
MVIHQPLIELQLQHKDIQLQLEQVEQHQELQQVDQEIMQFLVQ